MKFLSGKILTVAIATALAGSAAAGDSKDREHRDKMTSSVEAEMRSMDSNRDGKISASEHAAGAKQMFQGMDGNQDSRVTPVEMDAAQKPMKAADASHGHENHSGKAEMSSVDKIKVVDKDGDGVLTAQEHEAGSKKMFSKMDADKDGFLTAAEISAGHAKMMTADER
jgi:Ca2+-binding EF-hand superfamily protein